MKSIKLILIILIIISFNCMVKRIETLPTIPPESEWLTYNANGIFQFRHPAFIKHDEKLSGTDSYVEILKAPGITLYVLYDCDCKPLDCTRSKYSQCEEHWEIINGCNAQLSEYTYKGPSYSWSAIFFLEDDASANLLMAVAFETEEAHDLVLRIFRTIIFTQRIEINP